ncbi:hypothetical protein FIV42_08170 [Persicimonas caeni]|uniref:Uncharacterized protein n=1 Tax=Persicimonas caeni TaxID=2292766 RepID=A0A4Y6PQU5_PERCE|nr:EB domain-containing protein [Persicimonas caeni]QDG50704.1 hypothetical protein FIV42_08170 [Persicimonas caeni]QED31925.1 hypothetical protein FRD00_08165 [Persicimonas caeni]
MHRIHRSLWALVIMLTFFGCGGDPGSGNKPLSDAGGDADAGPTTDSESDTDIVSQQCTPDPELVAQENRCQIDDHCPCGTYCDLGRCIADCSEAADCQDGEVCDEFGRCRDTAATGLVPLPRQQADKGRIALDQRRLLLEEGREERLVIRVEERAVDRARATVSAGLQIKCPDQTDFSESCMLGPLAAGAAAELVVRRTAGEDPSDDVPTVTVHGPANTETAVVPRLDQLDGEAGNTDPVSIAGRYTGTMRLVGAGTDADLANLPEAQLPTEMSVQATVWDDAGEVVIAIDDPTGALTSAEQFIGTLTLEQDDDTDGLVDGQADFQTHPFIETTVAGRDHKLVAETVEAKLRSRLAPRTLSLAITQSYLGHGTTVAPTVEWAVDLQRSADTTAAVPDRSHLPAELGYDAAQRLAAASPWEHAFAGATPPSVTSLTHTFNHGGMDANLCGWSESERRAMHQALSGYWMVQEDKPSAEHANTYPQTAEFTAVYDQMQDVVGPNDPNEWLNVEDFQAQPPWSQYAHPSMSDGMACGFQDYTATTHFTGEEVSATANIDFCNDLAAKTGCQIKSVNFDHSFSMRAWLRHQETSSSYGTGPDPIDVSMTVTKLCELPSAPAYCGESISCIRATSTNPAAYPGWDFAESKLAEVDDLECADSALSAGIALDRAASQMTASEVLQKCPAELDMLELQPPAPGSPDAIFDAGAECVDVGRMLAAIGAQGRTLRPGATPLEANEQTRASAYTQRLLVRWLELHGFLAGETDQVAQMSEYFREGLNTTASDRIPPTVEEMVQKSTRGWDIFVTPHVANSVLQMPVEALVDPDYRLHRFGQTGDPTDEQKQSLAPVIFETLTRQADLLERYAEMEGPTNDPARQTPDALAEWMPRMLLAQTMAADIHQRALAAPSTPAWKDAYDSKLAQARANVAESLDYVRAVNAGANPLDIADTDLPLYFVADDADGIADRFSAITEYIAGRRDTADGWTSKAIDQAEASLVAAEEIYAAAADRQIRQERLNQWANELRMKYSDELFDFCGPHITTDDPSYDPIDDPDFVASSCALIDKPECTIDNNAYFDNWREEDILGRLCMHNEVTAATLAEDVGFASEAMRDFAAECYTDAMPDNGAVSIGACGADPQAQCLRCDWKGSVAEVQLGSTSLELAAMDKARDDGSSAEPSRNLQRAQVVCVTHHPSMRVSVPRPDNPLEVPGCVQGSIGEAYLDVVAAASDVDSARQAIVEHREAYDIEMESCFSLEETNEALQDARDSHLREMKDLRRRQLVADSIAHGAAAIKDCAATLAGSDKGVLGAGASAAASGVACGAAAAEAAANISSSALEEEMQNAQQRHDDRVATLEEDGELERCFIEAKQELVGMTTAVMDLERAAFDLERAQGELDERIAEAQAVHTEAYAYFADIDDSAEHDPAGDQWGRAEVEQYVRDFKLARRATYLAVRAVEYEYQQSLSQRQDVLEAKLPRDLRNVLSDLWDTAGTRKIGGNAPNELTVVVSLRDDILRLGDESAWPESMRPLSAVERFRTLLSSERYATYDEDGRYLGQRIPFELAPLEALDVEGGGVPIYSRTDCAERLWSLDAGVVGEQAYNGARGTMRLDLLQRNTFYSQWCSDQAGFQYSSVRPSRNLFRVPGVGKLDGTDNAANGVEAYSRARIQASVGTDHNTLESLQDSAGASTELATRGLYGDYALFIDAQFISRDGSEGLLFDKVDDILLRFDYLTVASR